MDCEKFEDAILDELYGELDEVTSAAVRRHASTCAKCGERLASMKATRSVLATALVPEPVPAGLEDRILAAAARAPIAATTNVTPMRSRGARFVSMAGRWAMRPQTAMAAVFLLMIGFSVVLVKSPSMRPSAAVTVTERGAPADNAAEAPSATATSDLAAAQAHGPEGRPIGSPMGSVAAAPTTLPQPESRPFESAKEVNTPSAAASAVAMADRAERKREDDPASNATGRSSRAPGGPAQGLVREEPVAMATPPAAPSPAPKPAARAAAAPMDDSVGSGAAAPSKQSADRAGGGGAGGDFATAMASYRGRRFSDATKQFDALAGQGDQSAALWAARSERDGSGCASAVPRYQRLATSAWGTTVGYDATLELGRCFRAMGSFESARGQFARLLTVPSHAGRAQAELDAMNPVRSKAASPPAAAPPATETR